MAFQTDTDEKLIQVVWRLLISLKYHMSVRLIDVKYVDMKYVIMIMRNVNVRHSTTKTLIDSINYDLFIGFSQKKTAFNSWLGSPHHVTRDFCPIFFLNFGNERLLYNVVDSTHVWASIRSRASNGDDVIISNKLAPETRLCVINWEMKLCHGMHS